MSISEQELIDLYEFAPCGFHSLDADGTFVHINTTELNWLGYARDEVIGRKVTDVLTLEAQLKFAEYFPRLKSSGLTRDLEMDFVRKDGTILPTLISATTVRDPRGEFVMSRSVVYDLTARKMADVRFRTILESAPDALIVCNREGKILLTNSQVEVVFGYRREELQGQALESLVPERFRGAHAAHREGFFANPKVRPMGAGHQLTGLRKDGSEFSVEISLSPLQLDEGPGALASVRDVTDRLRIESAVLSNEAQFRLLFENSLDGILRTTPDGYVLDANPAACAILGRTREQILAGGRSAVLDANDPAIATFLEERKRTGKAHGELMARRGNGTLFIQDTSSVIFRDPEGVETACTIFRDISDRKRAEAEREKLVGDLQEALKKVTVLSGLLSICSACKKIRDEKGHWEHLEVYIRDRSKAEFSHSVCPDCMQKLYPEYVKPE